MSAVSAVVRLSDHRVYRNRLALRCINGTEELSIDGSRVDVTLELVGASFDVLTAWCLGLKCFCLDPGSDYRWSGEAEVCSSLGGMYCITFRNPEGRPFPDPRKLRSGALLVLGTEDEPVPYAIRIKSFLAKT